MIKFEFEAIGTHWSIDIKEDLSKDREVSLLKNIKDRIDTFDKYYSRFRPDSLVTRMSKESGFFEMPEDFEKMFYLYKKAYEVTSGLLTPLIGQVLVDSGYDANYSLIKKSVLPKVRLWEEVMEWNNPKLTLKEPVLLDFGACGKGYLVDIVSELIESDGIKSYCVDAGGDMRHRSSNEESLKVGLEHPEDFESVIGVIQLKNKSLCGSAGNRRAWADMHHIINPETNTSPKNILAIWTIAGDTITADILTTCLFFVSTEKLKNYFNFEYLILNSDYTIEKSEGFTASVFMG